MVWWKYGPTEASEQVSVSILKMDRRETICASEAVNFTRIYGVKCQKKLNLIVLL